MHIGHIQLCFPVKYQCIISVGVNPPEALMSLDFPPKPDAGSLRLTAVQLDQAVALLRRSGCQRATVEAVRGDLAAGAPGNPDGTINLIAYAAWLVRALAEKEQVHGD